MSLSTRTGRSLNESAHHLPPVARSRWSVPSVRVSPSPPVADPDSLSELAVGEGQLPDGNTFWGPETCLDDRSLAW